jgi:hypothetical protein
MPGSAGAAIRTRLLSAILKETASLGGWEKTPYLSNGGDASAQISHYLDRRVPIWKI